MLPINGYNPAIDAGRLKEAMSGLGTNDSVLIDIIGHRTHAQRRQIVVEYHTGLGGDLLKELESETSGNYRSVLLKIMKNRDEMLAEILHDAMSGAGTNDGVLIDVMTQFPYELPAVAKTYQRIYGKTLESAIKGDTSGSYEDLLVTLLNTSRPAPNTVDPARAAQDAEAIYSAGEGRLGTNERAFMTLVAGNSREQLRLIDENYRRGHKKGLEDAVKAETSGHFRDALLACLTPYDKYFATRIHQSVARAGTNDLALITAFVVNEGPQLQAIAATYKTLFGEPMDKRVASDVSGDYKKILMALLEQK